MLLSSSDALTGNNLQRASIEKVFYLVIGIIGRQDRTSKEPIQHSLKIIRDWNKNQTGTNSVTSISKLLGWRILQNLIESWIESTTNGIYT